MLILGAEVPLCTLLFSVVLALCTSLLVKRWRIFSLFKQHGISGPTPSIIFGNWRELNKWKKNLVELQQQWTKKYGKVYGYYRGVSPRLVISDVKVLKQVLVKDIWNFTNRPDMSRSRDKMLPSLCDQRWKAVRSVLTPTFSAKKLRMMSQLMDQCTDTLLALVAEKTQDGRECDLYRHFQGLTMDVISKAALALELDCQRNQENFLLEVVRKIFQLEQSPVAHILSLMPEIYPLATILFCFSKGRTLTRFILDSLRDVIRHRRESGESGHYDILQLMLEAAEGKHIQESKSSEKTEEEKFFSEVPPKTVKTKTLLDDDEIMWNAFVFLLAGYETTSTALGFTAYFLTKYPEIQDRVFDEVDSIIGYKEQLSYNDVAQMTYLEQVLHESMRLFPPVPLFVNRICKKTVTVEGYTIPASSNVEVAVSVVHRDPDIWPHPDVFDPERFSPENKGKRHPLAFLPFGAGPRNCIGMRFALMEAKICVAKLIHKYRILPGKKWEDPIKTIIRNSTLNPENGVWVTVEPRTKH